MEIESHVVQLKLGEPFVISRSTTETAQVLDVEVRHQGQSGFGEATPIERYGESVDSARD